MKGFRGRFYTLAEIAEHLDIVKPRAYQLSRYYNWNSPYGGIYNADDVDRYMEARRRTELLGKKRLIWTDDNDTTCPVCEGFAVKVDGRIKCVNGHITND